MLQETIVFDALSTRQPGGPCTPGSATDIASGLVGSLQDLGLAPGLLSSATGVTAGGVVLQEVLGDVLVVDATRVAGVVIVSARDGEIHGQLGGVP